VTPEWQAKFLPGDWRMHFFLDGSPVATIQWPNPCRHPCKVSERSSRGSPTDCGGFSIFREVDQALSSQMLPSISQESKANHTRARIEASIKQRSEEFRQCVLCVPIPRMLTLLVLHLSFISCIQALGVSLLSIVCTQVAYCSSSDHNSSGCIP
jgi:hypothetical protein